MFYLLKNSQKFKASGIIKLDPFLEQNKTKASQETHTRAKGSWGVEVRGGQKGVLEIPDAQRKTAFLFVSRCKV